MRLFSTFLFSFLFVQLSLNGQFSEDFGDGELNNNPEWSGDNEDFRVNEDFELQLNASDAGSSILYTQSDFVDSMIWSMKLEMDFAPSSSNMLRIHLASDVIDFAQSTGYFLEIGENGSADAINFYKSTNGASEFLAGGSMGSMSNDPAYGNIIIQKTKDDVWSLKAAYNGSDVPELEFEIVETENLLPTNGYFGIECIYTSSRVEAFSFDDISVEELLPDVEAPVLTSVVTEDANTFDLSFSEGISASTANELSNYSISGLGNPDLVEFDTNSSNQVRIIYQNQGLESGTKYTLIVKNLEDLSGNRMLETEETLCLLEDALPGDLLINEVLFDPYQGGEDFIEIYNNSNKFIRLDGLMLSNDSKTNDFEILNTDMSIVSQGYLAISPDVAFLQEEYNPIATAILLNHAIPSFNNESGNVSISRFIDGVETSIDSFDYHEDMHFSLLTDTEGVSLERLSFSTDANAEGNWQSASSSVNHATPGYQNSNLITGNPVGDDIVQFDSQIFSPNQDGDNDQLVIRYELEQSGFVANIRIFDSNGFLVRKLVNNDLLSTRGFYLWDGLNEQRTKKLPIGMYIVMYEFFKPSGELIEGKKVCVLADQL